MASMTTCIYDQASDDEPRNAHAHLQALLLGNRDRNVCNGELQSAGIKMCCWWNWMGPGNASVAAGWLEAEGEYRKPQRLSGCWMPVAEAVGLTITTPMASGTERR